MTEGFRAIYPVGEQARPYGAAIFDVMYDKPALLVPQSRTGEVTERVDFRGNVLRAARRGGAARDLARAASRRRSSRSRCACCSRSCIPSTKRACARSRARRCRTAASRCPPTSCRRSANITGSPRRSSTPICSRSWRATSRKLDRRLNEAGITTRQKYIMQSNGGMATFGDRRAQGGDHGAVRTGRRRHRGRLCLPHDRLSATSSPSTWAAPPATWR